jgi:hypothetical protein
MLMPERGLPEDGELRLGGVMLSGERAYTEEGGNQLVAWVSDRRVRDAGRVWLELSDLAAQTGLRPVLSDLGAESFVYHGDVAALAELDAGEILAERWDDKTAPDGDPRADAWIARRHQPFTRQFPGLAAPVCEQLTVSTAEEALDTVPPQFVCLAAVSRPADFLTEVGWLITEAWDPPPPLSAVLRSWEDRFGARLLQIGPGAEIRLLVGRPPRTQDAALAVAAELWAFGDTVWVTHSSLEQVESVTDIASLIIDQPIWGFWWD